MPIAAFFVDFGARLNIIIIVDMRFYLTKATTLCHSRELVGLKPSRCTFKPISHFDFPNFEINFTSCQQGMFYKFKLIIQVLSITLTFTPRMVSKLWACSSIFFQQLSLRYLFLDSHPTMHHSNITVCLGEGKKWIRHIHLTIEHYMTP